MLTPDDLFLAYRQAKVAHYFERRGVGLIELAKFEQDLARQLIGLANALSRNNGWFDDLPQGQAWLVPKRLHLREDAEVIQLGARPPDSNTADLEIQVRYTPSPQTAIVEVLYLWKFGPILESLLSPSCLGHRLRIREDSVDTTGRWLFEYWPKRYEQFRTSPLDTAESELRNNGSAVLLTADLASFYDSIDPSFLIDEAFVSQLKKSGGHRFANSFEIEEYSLATESLLRFYERFRITASRRTGIDHKIGIPIGALTSRLVGNLALATLDKSIKEKSNSSLYLRYVDDFVIVSKARDLSGYDLSQVIQELVPHISEKNGIFKLDESTLERKGSRLTIQSSKCKAYVLQGIPGRQFLSAVRNDFGRLVSEQRAFLDPILLDEGELPSLVRAGPSERPLTVLRDADRSRLERFQLSNRLSSLERITTLVFEEATRHRVRHALAEAIRFLRGHGDWVENLDAIFRMLRLSVRIGDWHSAQLLIQYTDDLWPIRRGLDNDKQRLLHQGILLPSRAWTALRDYLHLRRIEAICSVIRKPMDGVDPRVWLAKGIAIQTKTIGWRGILNRARLLRAADLRSLDREDDEFGSNRLDTTNADSHDFGLHDSQLTKRLSVIEEFVGLCKHLSDSPWVISSSSLFLCTRPPSYFDVARRLLHRTERKLSSNAFTVLLEWVNAIRGTRYADPVGEVVDECTVRIPGAEISADEEREDPQIILGNLELPKSYFDNNVSGLLKNLNDPVLTIPRLRDLNQVLIAATERSFRHKPGNSLLVLPELSLPRSWFRTVAKHVSKNRSFGLIVGLEYNRHPNRPWVFNQAYAVIPGPFGSVATWPWTKQFPAREEHRELEKHGLSFGPIGHGQSSRRIVVQSPYGNLAVLICSELLEAAKISDLMGRAEVIAVPAWNRDTASYDHLIQTVGLQLHAIVAVANNGNYSDSRVWAPREIRWERDLCRLIERQANGIVGVTIPLASLRSFHGQGSKGEKEWKPLPPRWPKIP